MKSPTSSKLGKSRESPDSKSLLRELVLCVILLLLAVSKSVGWQDEAKGRSCVKGEAGNFIVEGEEKKALFDR